MKKILLVTFCMLTFSANASIESNGRVRYFLDLPQNSLQPDNSFEIANDQGVKFKGKLLCSHKDLQDKIDSITEHIDTLADLFKKEDTEAINAWDKQKAQRQIKDYFSNFVISDLLANSDENTVQFHGDFSFPAFKDGSYLIVTDSGKNANEHTLYTKFNIISQHIQKVESTFTTKGFSFLDAEFQYDLNTVTPLLENALLSHLITIASFPSRNVQSYIRQLPISEQALNVFRDFHITRLRLNYEQDKPLISLTGDTNDNIDINVFSPQQEKVLNINWFSPILKLLAYSPTTKKTLMDTQITFPDDIKERSRKYLDYLVTSDIDPFWAFHIFTVLANKTKIDTSFYYTDGSPFAKGSIKFKDDIVISIKNGPQPGDLFDHLKFTINKQTAACPVKEIGLNRTNPKYFTIYTTTGYTSEDIDGTIKILSPCFSEYLDSLISDVVPQFENASQSVMGNIDGIITNKKTNTPAVKETDYSKQHEKQNTKGPKTQQIDAPANIVSSVITDTTNYSLGNPKGKYVIIEFFDYNCGHCRKSNSALLEALARSDVQNIRWIPLDTPIFKGSELLARYVLAAGKQGKYMAMHEAITKKTLSQETDLIALGNKLGLDTQKLKKDAHSDEITNKLNANQELWKQLKASGVPAFIVNGKIHQGGLRDTELEKIIQESKESQYTSPEYKKEVSTQEKSTTLNTPKRSDNALYHYAMKRHVVSNIISSTMQNIISAQVQNKTVTDEGTSDYWESIYVAPDGSVVLKLKKETPAEDTLFSADELAETLKEQLQKNSMFTIDSCTGTTCIFHYNQQ